MSTPAPVVLHLVRGGNELAALERFLRSYRAHPAGVEHRLCLILKGFAGPNAAAPHLALAEGLDAETLSIPDVGFDLDAYWAAARTLDAERYCLLNSFSEILADGWLGRLLDPLADPQVGLVGASGSWASLASLTRFQLGLGGPYRAVFGEPRATGLAFRALAGERGHAVGGLRRHLWWVGMGPTLPAQLARYPTFPAPHLRTNALAVYRELLLAAAPARPLRRKDQAHRLESGRRSLTRLALESGLGALVVDREGRRFGPAEWADSETFWQGAQAGLLVADNQTRDYAGGDGDRRVLLARYAWGHRARPAAPGTDQG